MNDFEVKEGSRLSESKIVECKSLKRINCSFFRFLSESKIVECKFNPETGEIVEEICLNLK